MSERQSERLHVFLGTELSGGSGRWPASFLSSVVATSASSLASIRSSCERYLWASSLRLAVGLAGSKLT